MFSKSKIHESGAKPGTETDKQAAAGTAPPPRPLVSEYTPSSSPRVKLAPSVLSADLTVTGNLKTSGDIQVEGVVEGDIRPHLLTVGETAPSG